MLFASAAHCTPHQILRCIREDGAANLAMSREHSVRIDTLVPQQAALMSRHVQPYDGGTHHQREEEEVVEEEEEVVEEEMEEEVEEEGVTALLLF